MVKIVFSDGSKQMAHNLDDLRQRWELRRQEEKRLVDSRIDIGLIDFTPSPDIAAMLLKRDEIFTVYQETQQQLSMINAVKNKTQGEKATRARLAAQFTYYAAVMNYFKSTLAKPTAGSFSLSVESGKALLQQYRETQQGKLIIGLLQDELKESMTESAITANARARVRELTKEVRALKRRIRELENT